MQNDFILFGPVHLAILGAIPAIAWTISRISRMGRDAARKVRIALGVLLAINELIWYGYRYSTEGVRFPEGLPLNLCDITVWLTVVAALRLHRWIFEFVFFAGLGGTSMALITPDLWAPLWSYPSIYFFVAHGLVVTNILNLVWGGTIRPRPGCLWRVFFVLNVYAFAAGTFNLIFHTNYMYLCEKPASATLLDWFGPWPIYIVVGEIFALSLFALMWLPFRRDDDSGAAT